MGTFRSSIHRTGTGHPSEAGQAICDTDALKSAIPDCSACEAPQPGAIVTKRVATRYKNSSVRRHSSGRRILVVVVPPVDELDLVGPLQIFNSVNRLAGRNIYAIEVVTNADSLTVEGEGGVLTFMAKHHFDKVEGDCDSVLLVCGLGTRSVRDAVLSAWLKKMASEVRRLGAVCVGAFLLAEAGLLNDRRAERPHIGDSAAKWQHDIRVSGSSMIHSGSKTGTSTPRPEFLLASISRSPGWRKIAALVWRMKRRANWFCFCDAREDSRN